MAGSINKVILIGNLGVDPEIRATQDGKEIANFSLATTESWKDKMTGERRDKTEWHRVAVFNQQLVNVAKNFLRKGSKVYLEGNLQTRKWTDQNGVERYTTEVILQNFTGQLTMLDTKASQGQDNGGFYNNQTPANDSFNQNQNSFNDTHSGGGSSFGSNTSNIATETDIDDDLPF